MRYCEIITLKCLLLYHDTSKKRVEKSTHLNTAKHNLTSTRLMPYQSIFIHTAINICGIGMALNI